MCQLPEFDGPCELWDERTHRARTRHRCSACFGPIEPGTRYLANFSKSDGDVSYTKLCEPCQAARVEFCREHLEGGELLEPSTFGWMLDECLREEPDSRARWLPMREAMQARAQTWRAE